MANMSTTAKLREKEIINVCDGSRLGRACDFEFDICDARITALIVSDGSGFLGFGKQRDIIIPWCKIECIGADTILVKLTQDEKNISCDCVREKGKKWF